MPTNNKLVNYAIVSATDSVVLSVGRTDLEIIELMEVEGILLYPVPEHIYDEKFAYDWEAKEFVELPDKPKPWSEWGGTEWITEDRSVLELEATKKILTGRVNEEIGLIRTKYITCIEGQEMLYLDKEREAVAFLSDPEPNMVDYPFISREVGVTATTAQELAQIWLNSAFMWRQIAAELEKQRFEAINAIAIATTYEEIETIVDQFKTDVSVY